MDACKICDWPELTVVAHTGKCNRCAVLLCYPYPNPAEGRYWTRERALYWYTNSSFLNHANFSRMALFTLTDRNKPIDVLDFGGGGGQFALVCKSLFPRSEVYIVDANDDALLDEWRSVNRQIPFKSFPADKTLFDAIFMNDVFEHLEDPAGVLKGLAGRLKGSGCIFIDTPRQFWLYPVLKVLSPKLYARLLRGTVDHDHVQIWSREAFNRVVKNAGLRIAKYREISEFSMPPSFYLSALKVRNPIIKLMGYVFYKLAPLIARNKIMAVLEPIRR